MAACAPVSLDDGDALPPRPARGDGGATDDPGEGDVHVLTDPEVHVDAEEVPGVPVDDDTDALFAISGVREIALTLDKDSVRDMQRNPREYTDATMAFDGGSWVVGVALKGNSSYQEFDAKPSFKVDVNAYVEGQEIYDEPSFYLQNMIYDPSAMHEQLAYGFFNTVGVAASRSSYARLTVNGADYGLYLLLEKENGPFLERWLGDKTGSVYESGSFNYPCDLDSGNDGNPCSCMEQDRVGSNDSVADLQAFCTAARQRDGWWEGLEPFLDREQFLRAQAAEMVVSHYDNYGWNINNWRIAHNPSDGRWTFTPWSTDLAFGWYPWMGNPHCGTYGKTPDEYQQGHLITQCWRDATCTAALESALSDLLVEWEEADLVSQIDALDALLRPYVETDPRRSYSLADYDREVACMRTFSTDRAASLQGWLDAR